MKKAKLVLSAIAVFAVIGGAFAFKASFAQKNVWCKTSGSCLITSYRTLPIAGAVTTNQPCAGTNVFYTASNCPATVAGTVYFTTLQ
jgi:hypothetical protein